MCGPDVRKQGTRNVKFGMVEAVKDRKETTLLKSIATAATLYQKAGIKVTTALMDGEFVDLRGGGGGGVSLR